MTAPRLPRAPRLTSLWYQVKRLEALIHTDPRAEDDQRREALRLAEKAFTRVYPHLEIHQQLAALARAYAASQYRREHPEIESPEYQGPRLNEPMRSPEEIAAEYSVCWAQLEQLVVAWIADGAPGIHPEDLPDNLGA